MRYSKEEQKEAREKLLRIVKPGDTLYTILRHVSRSGMNREISVIHIDKNGRISFLDWSVGVLLGYPLGESEGIKVRGCGMDMGYHLIYSLSNELFKEYTCLGEGKTWNDTCHSSEHINGTVPRDGKMKHKNGYCLNHRWL